VGCDEIEDEFISIEVEDHQELKQIEDQIADLILCLDSTLDTVSTFEEMYHLFDDHQNFGIEQTDNEKRYAYGADAVVFALREKAKEILYTRKKAEALLSKVQNTRTLVSDLSSLENQRLFREVADPVLIDIVTSRKGKWPQSKSADLRTPQA
jgi:hypothetical protein